MVAYMLFFYPLLGVMLFRHPNAAARAILRDVAARAILRDVAAILRDEVCEQEAMLVVSPAGVLHALNPSTKHTIWTFASGSDMGSNLPTTGISSGEDTNNQTAYSGSNGTLFIVEGSEVRATEMNMRDLIADTPWVTADLTLVTSSVSSMAFVLNKDTGALIRNFNILGGSVWGKSEPKVPTLFFRRTDYSVIEQGLATGALHWKVSVAHISIMGPRSYDHVPIALFSSKGKFLNYLLPEPPSALGKN